MGTHIRIPERSISLDAAELAEKDRMSSATGTSFEPGRVYPEFITVQICVSTNVNLLPLYVHVFPVDSSSLLPTRDGGVDREANEIESG